MQLSLLTNIMRPFQIRDILQDVEADDTLIDYERIPDLTCKNLPDWDSDYYIRQDD